MMKQDKIESNLIDSDLGSCSFKNDSIKFSDSSLSNQINLLL